MISKEFGEVIWLWTILFKGKACHPYNVCSDQAITIAELAQTVATVLWVSSAPRFLTSTFDHNKALSRYVPDTNKMTSELSPLIIIELKGAVKKTISWHQVVAI